MAFHGDSLSGLTPSVMMSVPSESHAVRLLEWRAPFRLDVARMRRKYLTQRSCEDRKTLRI
jgi:hypothetical protein